MSWRARMAWGVLPNTHLTLTSSGQQDSQTPQRTGWSTTGKLALWSSQHLPRCPSYLLIPWRCGSKMAAKSATYWSWHWVSWKEAAHAMWSSRVRAGQQGRLSAALRLSSGGYQACTSSPSCASWRLRTAGSQPYLTQASTPSRCAAMCLRCGYCSVGTPWTRMSVATSHQGHPLAWAPLPAPVVAPDPEEGLETRGSEDLLQSPVLQTPVSGMTGALFSRLMCLE